MLLGLVKADQVCCFSELWDCLLQSWVAASSKAVGLLVVARSGCFRGLVDCFGEECRPFCVFERSHLAFFGLQLRLGTFVYLHSSKGLTHCCIKDWVYHCPKASKSCQLYLTTCQFYSSAEDACSLLIAYHVRNMHFVYLRGLNSDLLLLSFLGSLVMIQLDVFPVNMCSECAFFAVPDYYLHL